MKTKEKLAGILNEAGAPIGMVVAASDGEYDDFESKSPTPINDLVRDCRKYGLNDIATRAMNGEFDATKEESQEWMEREGKDLFRKGF